MNIKKIKQLLQSVAVLPLFAVMPVTGIVTTPVASVVISQNSSVIDSLAITTPEEKIRKEEAAKIDAFFASRNSPLEGYGMTFVLEAEKNGLDPFLLPAVSIIESSGGLDDCNRVSNSVFGYGSCKIGFPSIENSIEVVSRSLGGHSKNPSTAYRPGMTTEQILAKYNTVIPTYTKKVKNVISMISNTDTGSTVLARS